MALSEKDIAYFKTMSNRQLDDYEKTLSDWEAKGNDATDYRQAVADRREQIVIEAEQKRQEALNRPKYQLNKLEAYRSVPRNPQSDFFKDIAGSAPFFGKSKWLEKYQNAPIIYCAVVQANYKLWNPGNETSLPLVLVFALDDAHKYNIEWLKSVAEKISDLSDSAVVPDDCKKLISTLRNDQSIFNFKIGSSIAGNANAWCATFTIDKQSNLGNSCLPADKILPFIITGVPKDNYSPNLKLIASKYYM